MSEQIKFTDEEMNNIKQVQELYREKTAMFGQLSFQKFQLERQLETAQQAEAALKKEIIDLEQEKQLLLKSKSQIIKLGFIFDDYGDNSIIVREIPAILGKIKIKLLFEDLLEQIKRNINKKTKKKVSN